MSSSSSSNSFSSSTLSSSSSSSRKTSFSQWCNQSSFVTKIAAEATHTRLDGGMLKVPMELNDVFLQHYLAAIEDGSALFVVEYKSRPAFKLAAEFDIKLPDREVSADEKTRISSIVCDTVRKLFPDSVCCCIVSTVEPKEGESSAGANIAKPARFVQSGLHFNWAIPVSSEIAMAFVRPVVVAELNKQIPHSKEFPLVGTWEDAYDPCIYQRNGLRLMWSHKCTRCRSCKGKPMLRSTCEECHGRVIIDKGRPYTPFAIYADGIMGSPTGMSNIEIIMFCSLRLPKCETAQLCSNFDKLKLDEYVASQESHSNIISVALSRSLNHPNKITAKSNATDLFPVDPASEEYSLIENFVSTKMPLNPTIRSVKTNCNSAKRRTAFLVSTRSHFCMNKGAEHGSSFVFFVLSLRGCSQHCFSKNSYRGVECSNYRSDPTPLPPEMLRVLFPEGFSAANRRLEKEHQAMLSMSETIKLGHGIATKKLLSGSPVVEKPKSSIKKLCQAMSQTLQNGSINFLF